MRRLQVESLTRIGRFNAVRDFYERFAILNQQKEQNLLMNGLVGEIAIYGFMDKKTSSPYKNGDT
ncbi:MAG: hypothetical protein EAZ24_03475 [Burkholderiales bacterium]|nr:MAG: hypothetical protein EAZ21_10800 [Betaproteobacteria bacterium]TAG82748.1 MAG: hypothetical protein EAZ24_03475 [Burkholderiales bacterium]